MAQSGHHELNLHIIELAARPAPTPDVLVSISSSTTCNSLKIFIAFRYRNLYFFNLKYLLVKIRMYIQPTFLCQKAKQNKDGYLNLFCFLANFNQHFGKRLKTPEGG